jgi:sulfotransferase
MKTFHFVAGLPRSGSTLLCNILAQNPRFYATHTSGCIEVLLLMRNNWDKLAEHRANLDWPALERVLASTLQTYHSTDRPVIFDKSRAWLAYIEFLENILQRKAKVLVTVRPVVDILASFEKLYRKNTRFHTIPGENDNYFKFQSIEGRSDYLMETQNVVGLSHLRVREALLRGLRDRFLFVDFDTLTKSPEKKMKEIYDFLDEKYFSHDFGKVKQVTQENDVVHGFLDLHLIREKVAPVLSDARQVLGDHVFEKYASYKLPV